MNPQQYIPNEIERISTTISFYEKLATDHPDDSFILWRLGGSYAIAARFNEAITCFLKCIELDSTFSRPYHNLALAYQAIGQYKEALQYFDKSIELNPLAKMYYINKGHILFLLENYIESVAAFKKAIELAKEDFYSNNILEKLLIRVLGYVVVAGVYKELIEPIKNKISEYNLKCIRMA